MKQVVTQQRGFATPWNFTSCSSVNSVFIQPKCAGYKRFTANIQKVVLRGAGGSDGSGLNYGSERLRAHPWLRAFCSLSATFFQLAMSQMALT